MKGIAFKDRVFVRVQAGDGGDGCCAFRREKFVPRGGPNGGDGGDGASVILKATKDVDSLVGLYFQPIQKAPHGGKGEGWQRTGELGKDLIIPVPCGTTVWEVEARDSTSAEAFRHPTDQPIEVGEEPTTKRGSIFDAERNFFGEVINDGDTLVIAKGGIGGKGNQNFATSTNQAPRKITEGTPGEARTLIMELKTVADVGLVGYPNAGKSTLLAALTNAQPKIAPYPFTTINPIIGIMSFEDYTTVRVADIPGLIDGAHEGIGLGYDFLRHIERSGFLLFIIDMAGTDGRSPVEDYRKLRRELKLYSKELLTRPSLVIANKMDEPVAAENLKEFKRRTKTRPLAMSAVLGEGVPELKEALHAWKKGSAG